MSRLAFVSVMLPSVLVGLAAGASTADTLGGHKDTQSFDLQLASGAPTAASTTNCNTNRIFNAVGVGLILGALAAITKVMLEWWFLPLGAQAPWHRVSDPAAKAATGRITAKKLEPGADDDTPYSYYIEYEFEAVSNTGNTFPVTTAARRGVSWTVWQKIGEIDSTVVVCYLSEEPRHCWLQLDAEDGKNVWAWKFLGSLVAVGCLAELCLVPPCTDAIDSTNLLVIIAIVVLVPLLVVGASTAFLGRIGKQFSGRTFVENGKGETYTSLISAGA